MGVPAWTDKLLLAWTRSHLRDVRAEQPEEGPALASHRPARPGLSSPQQPRPCTCMEVGATQRERERARGPQTPHAPHDEGGEAPAQSQRHLAPATQICGSARHGLKVCCVVVCVVWRVEGASAPGKARQPRSLHVLVAQHISSLACGGGRTQNHSSQARGVMPLAVQPPLNEERDVLARGGPQL